ncbi:GrpB family protein [Solibacillus isronensis]|uniref:GrpB family protein n=1 Tax=Solibacillus isronensis TaxID=412383 RepID=UPI002040174E|nr:GrpB family protein [Solibacillus isronensis]MCM3720957.1 GrpB family protein [Solibacillus isronensis]
MKLGLKKDEVILVPYEASWKREFAETKEKILKHTSLQPYQIEHIGSTSIEGIAAKPVIDLVIGIENLDSPDKELFKGLREAGFYRLQVERPNEIICAKFTDATFEMKTHFIHIVQFNEKKWHQMRFFRDYLNAHIEAKKEYEELKEAFFNTGLHGINEYTQYKEQFVQSIFRKLPEYRWDTI